MQNNFYVESYYVLNDQIETKVKTFLNSVDISLDSFDKFYTMCNDGGEIIATGGIDGNVIKYVAVAHTFRGLDLTSTLLTQIIQDAYKLEISHLFVFTKIENKNIFKSLGFYEVIKTENIILMENIKDGVLKYVNSIKKDGFVDENACIVMNCNPFTLGHQYLIEQASIKSKSVHIFVVKEDQSVFPYHVRIDLVKKGTNHLSNVFVHEGSDYIISSATFPSYFIKDKGQVNELHTELDVRLFASVIAKELCITKRYVGEEPLCVVTRNYNSTMLKILPEYGIEVEVIKRKENKNEAISASRVREYLEQNNLKDILEIVPESTYDFLVSEEGKSIVQKLQRR
jgi:[citrate (pro-3S)-lyase] ligase